MENIKTQQSQFFQRRIDYLQIHSKQPVLSNYESERRRSLARNYFPQCGDSKIESQVTTDSTSSLQVSGQNHSQRYAKKQQSLFGTHLNIPSRVNISPLTLSTEFQAAEYSSMIKAPNFFHVSPASSPQILRPPQYIKEYNEPFHSAKNSIFVNQDQSTSHQSNKQLNQRISVMTKSSDLINKQKVIYLSQFKRGKAQTPQQKYREKMMNFQKSSKDRISVMDHSSNLKQEQFPPSLKKDLQNIGKIADLPKNLNEKRQQHEFTKLFQPDFKISTSNPQEQLVDPKIELSKQEVTTELNLDNKIQLKRKESGVVKTKSSSDSVNKKLSSNQLVNLVDDIPSRKASNKSLSNQMKEVQRNSQNNLLVNKVNLIRRTTITGGAFISGAFRSMRTTGRESQTRKIELFSKASEIKTKYNRNHSFDDSEHDSDSLGSIRSDSDSDNQQQDKGLLNLNILDKGKKSRKASIAFARRNSSLKELTFGFGNEFSTNVIFDLDIENRHTEEAYKQFLNKGSNPFDMPQRNQRMIRPQLKIEIDNLGTSNSGKKNNRYDDIKVEVPEPMTSLMPKKKKMLDASKLSVIKDDRSESNITVSNKNETSSDKQLRNSFGGGGGGDKMLSTFHLGSPGENSLMVSRKISSLKGIGRSGSSITPRSTSNIGGSGKKSSLSSQMGEERSKITNEIAIKKNKNYIKMMKKFINICDKHGKSALAYAAQKSQIGLVKILLERGAVPITRDYKNRKPIDLTTCDDLLSLLSQQEALFEEKFSGSLKTFRKSLIMDEHSRLRNIQQQQKMGRDALMSYTDIIKEIKEDDVESVIEQKQSLPKSQNKIIKDIGRRLTNKMQMNKAELSSWSDKLLVQYQIGIYKDNALTYKMRFEDKENFQYLLKRGISVLCRDKNGNNILHYAIQLEKVEFLSYLLEGSFQSEIYERSLSLSSDSLFDLFTHQKAKDISALLRTGQYPWIQESLYALEKSNDREGNNSLHMAIDIGNNQLFCYIVTILKIRDHMRFMDKNKYMKLFNSYPENLEFKNKHQQTPLLYAAKRNQYKIFQELLVQGASIYTQCSKFMNVLHYAVLNENKNLIEQIVYSDAESDKLLNERNYRNLTPVMIDDKKKYEDIFNHIWSSVSVCTPTNLEHMEYLLANDKFTVNQKTLIGQNTPLHIAVLNENFKAIEHLCKYKDIHLHERNSIGQTPKDLALLIPKKRSAVKIIEFINKKINLIAQREKANLSPSFSKTQSIVKKSTFNKKSAAVRLGTINKNSFQIVPQSTEKQSNGALGINAQQSEQTFLSINFSTQIKELIEITGKVITGMDRTNSNMGRKASALSLDSSEKSDDYFDEESSIGSNMYLMSQNSMMDNEFKSNPHGKSVEWEQHKILKLQNIYDIYIENADLIGNLNAQLFIKWKTLLTKIDDTLVQKSKELFRQYDDKRRGYIMSSFILTSKGPIQSSGIMEEKKCLKFFDQLDKQYQETKITEPKFIQLIMEYATKQSNSGKVTNPNRQLKECPSADSVQLLSTSQDKQLLINNSQDHRETLRIRR